MYELFIPLALNPQNPYWYSTVLPKLAGANPVHDIPAQKVGLLPCSSLLVEGRATNILNRA